MKKIIIENGQLGTVETVVKPIDTADLVAFTVYSRAGANGSIETITALNNKFRWIFARCISSGWSGRLYDSVEEAIKSKIERGFSVIIVPKSENPITKLFD